ncbi:MAG TPA: DUF2294 family protein [bacterium (Candidatus Stahlbacteria)]|nr:DUF2294 family protein [Candidatus Stahlbacteria bacterium]
MSKKEELKKVIGEAMLKFLREQIGENPKEVNTIIENKIILVRFKKALPTAEKHLLMEGVIGVKDLKERIMKGTRPLLEDMIKDLTGAKVISVHSDVNVETQERIILLTLDKSLEKD